MPNPLPVVLRNRDAPIGVTNMELFFDLVYVFAVTQLSHALLTHLSLRGALQTAILFGAVWWAWNYTAWATNWIDPDQLIVRLLMISLMLLSLVMAASLPDAFGEQAFAFAGAYVAMQLLRSMFMVWALRGTTMGRNYAHLLTWSIVAGVAWMAGASMDGETRTVLWIVALVLDYGAPLVGYALPRLGRTLMSGWDLRPAHLAERCQLIVIIALGESVLVTGATFAELERTTAVVAAFVVTFVGSAALWWLYFARHAEAASARLSMSKHATELGRGGYAYAHAVLVAGVIVAAVGFELVIAHPSGELDTATALVVVLGPALFNLGMLLFVHTTGGIEPFDWIVGVITVALFAVVAVALSTATPLALETAITAVLVGVVAAAAWHARAETADFERSST